MLDLKSFTTFIQNTTLLIHIIIILRMTSETGHSGKP